MPIRGKWAAGIEPRGFTWVYRGAFAVAERPGGAVGVHRQVRRDEELLWLKHQGFSRVVTVAADVPTPSVYGEHGLSLGHYAMRAGAVQRDVLAACYGDLARCLGAGTVVLLHDDEVSDRLLGVVAGFLVWSGRAPTVPASLTAVERLFRRSVGPEGRGVLFDLPGAGRA